MRPGIPSCVAKPVATFVAAVVTISLARCVRGRLRTSFKQVYGVATCPRHLTFSYATARCQAALLDTFRFLYLDSNMLIT
jgi:hypothetical protein